MSFFHMEATIKRWVDADTLDVHPKPYRHNIDLRVRLKDSWAVEIGEIGHEEALKVAKLTIGDVGDEVILTNTRHHWTWERLECRVDRGDN